LPGWAEMDGRDDGLEPTRQREMIEAFAASRPGVSAVDPSDALARAGSEKTYGILDKHLTAYGHFIVAQAVERWLVAEWPLRPRLSAPPAARTFEPQPRITPDCSRADEYLAAIRAR